MALKRKPIKRKVTKRSAAKRKTVKRRVIRGGDITNYLKEQYSKLKQVYDDYNSGKTSRLQKQNNPPLPFRYTGPAVMY
jgi:hypothetical protein